MIEGTVIEPKLARPATAASPRLPLKHKRIRLTTTASGEVQLTAILTPAGADRVRRALAGE